MDTTNNKGAPSQGTPSETPRSNSNSAHAQRQRLLERLKISPIDTVTARQELDILCPAARVLELRKRGHNIETVWIERQTDCGKVHRVALYVLKAGEVSDE
jgi:hypothetical protein